MTSPPQINQDTINRLTIAASQRPLTNPELAEYLEQHAAMATLIATTPATALVPVPDIARKVHSMNAQMFVHAAAVVTRMVDLDQAVSEMMARAKTSAALSATDTGRVLWEAREQALGDVLALIRAVK